MSPIKIISLIAIFVLACFITFTYYPSNQNSLKPHLLTEQTDEKKIILSNEYVDHLYGFSIKYPANWTYASPYKSTVIFKGKKGSPSPQVTILAGLIIFHTRDGIYKNAEAYIQHIKNIFANMHSNPIVLEEGPINIQQENGKLLQGQYLALQYQNDKKDYIQYQVIIDNNDEKNFYVIAYNSPLGQYKENLPILKAMVYSLQIDE